MRRARRSGLASSPTCRDYLPCEPPFPIWTDDVTSDANASVVHDTCEPLAGWSSADRPSVAEGAGVRYRLTFRPLATVCKSIANALIARPHRFPRAGAKVRTGGTSNPGSSGVASGAPGERSAGDAAQASLPRRHRPVEDALADALMMGELAPAALRVAAGTLERGRIDGAVRRLPRK